MTWRRRRWSGDLLLGIVVAVGLGGCRFAGEGLPLEAGPDLVSRRDIGAREASSTDGPRADAATLADGEPPGPDVRIFGDGGLPPDSCSATEPPCAKPRDSLLGPVADTLLAAGGNNFDDVVVMNIGMPESKGVSSGVLRFDLADISGLTSGDQLLALALELSPAVQAEDCGASCGKCGPLEHGGPFEVRAMTNDWTPKQITWNLPKTGSTWDQPGASGASDRGIVLARSTYLRGSALRFTMDCSQALRAELARWVSGGKQTLSLQVISLGGQIVAATSEANACPGSHVAPVLRVHWCAP